MSQNDSEIKTISRKTVSRNFKFREIESEKKDTNQEGKAEEKISRRNIFQTALPRLGNALVKILRQLNGN